jgi:thymidylate kinase
MTMARREEGKVVMIAGPDGVGKSTLAESMMKGELRGRPVLLVHHRQAGVLPARRMRGSGTEPHRHPPYPWLVSLAKMLYLFLDFRLAWALRIEPFRRRGGWVLLQRNWWDAVIDPTRYRLRSSPRLARALGRLLPQPDLIFVLEAPPAVIAGRKQELPQEELERQTLAWKAMLEGRPGVTFLDASLSPDQLARQATNQLLWSERRRDEEGWVNLPSRSDPRWTIRRGPPSRTATGLSLYQPVRVRGLAAWSLARILARTGSFRLLPRGQRPPAALQAILAPHVPTGGTVAVARSSHPQRQVALIVGPGGDRQIAKVAYSADARQALEREAEMIRILGPLLSPPVNPPIILGEAEGLLLLRGVRPLLRARPWHLPPEVAHALGRLFRAGADQGLTMGPAHADFAPWNLVRSGDSWTLVDWEHARVDAPPFHDVFHWLFQAHDLLGRPSRRALLAGLRGRGWVGEAIGAYARGAGLNVTETPRFLLIYLDERSRREHLTGVDELQRAVRAVSEGP